MSEFGSEDAYWHFSAAVIGQSRYVRSRRSSHFLNVLKRQASDRVELLSSGRVIYRAQLAHDWETEELDEGVTVKYPGPCGPSRIVPRTDRATEGRANPKGIPYFYCATHRNTAMAEVRPWIGSHISLGEFRVVRDLRIVNCTEHGERTWFVFGDTPLESWGTNVWCDVDDVFSRPVAPSDDAADYAPTQVIAECLKAAGFDGVAYRSALGDGLNLALFDPSCVELHCCGLFDAKAISFEFKQAANPYFIERERGASI